MAKKQSPRSFAIMGYAVVFLTFGVLGGWAAVAKIDSAVVAPGTIALEGNRKVVQHLEGGIVQNVRVDEADKVEKGDLLLRLNDIEARANLIVTQNRMNVALVIEARLLAERDMADTFNVPDSLRMENPSETVRSTIKDQKSQFEDRRSILRSQIDILSSQIKQTEEQVRGLEIQKSALDRRVANFDLLMDRMRRGEESGLIQSNMLSQREDEMMQIEASRGDIISQIAQAKNALNQTEYEKIKIKQEYKQRANTELKDVRAEISELEERTKVTADVLSRTEIRAPGSGTIQNLQVHTIGSVIQPGDTLMELVPENEELIVNARVSPRDIDNVSEGLDTEVRFTAFKSKLTPIMLGRVRSVSDDIITPESNQEPPYYLVRIKVANEDISEDVSGRLTAGMPADVIITSGERTVAYYIASPILDAVRKSLIEE